MLKFKATGKTISQAIQNGLDNLNIGKDDVVVRVIQNPQNFVLAKVEICVSDEIVAQNPKLKELEKLQQLDEEIKNAEAKINQSREQKNHILQSIMPNFETKNFEKIEAETPLDFAQKFVFGIVSEADIDGFEIDAKEDENFINVTLNGQGLKCLIGRAGKTLSALQFVVNLVVGRRFKDAKHIVIDINQFKEVHRQKIATLASESAKKVLETGQAIELEPMNAFERRIVHAEVAGLEELKTESRGEEPNRFVVIMRKP